jgi:hypothetical protein
MIELGRPAGLGEWNSMRTGPGPTREASSTNLGLPNILVASMSKSARRKTSGTPDSSSQTLASEAEAPGSVLGSTNNTDTLLMGRVRPPVFLHRLRLAEFGNTTEKSESLVLLTCQSQFASTNLFRSSESNCTESLDLGSTSLMMTVAAFSYSATLAVSNVSSISKQ